MPGGRAGLCAACSPLRRRWRRRHAVLCLLQEALPGRLAHGGTFPGGGFGDDDRRQGAQRLRGCRDRRRRRTGSPAPPSPPPPFSPLQAANSKRTERLGRGACALRRRRARAHHGDGTGAGEPTVGCAGLTLAQSILLPMCRPTCRCLWACCRGPRSSAQSPAAARPSARPRAAATPPHARARRCSTAAGQH